MSRGVRLDILTIGEWCDLAEYYLLRDGDKKERDALRAQLHHDSKPVLLPGGRMITPPAWW